MICHKIKQFPQGSDHLYRQTDGQKDGEAPRVRETKTSHEVEVRRFATELHEVVGPVVGPHLRDHGLSYIRGKLAASWRRGQRLDEMVRDNALHFARLNIHAYAHATF